jgi:hypothetical protein
MARRVPGEMPTPSMSDESQQTMDQGQHGEMPMRPMNAEQPLSERGAQLEDQARAISSASESEVQTGGIDAELAAYREAQDSRVQDVSKHGEMPIKDMN